MYFLLINGRLSNLFCGNLVVQTMIFGFITPYKNPGNAVKATVPAFIAYLGLFRDKALKITQNTIVITISY
jgi:hypothetical protein